MASIWHNRASIVEWKTTGISCVVTYVSYGNRYVAPSLYMPYKCHKYQDVRGEGPDRTTLETALTLVYT
jgi:hypothetical protein